MNFRRKQKRNDFDWQDSIVEFYLLAAIQIFWLQ